MDIQFKNSSYINKIDCKDNKRSNRAKSQLSKQFQNYKNDLISFIENT